MEEEAVAAESGEDGIDGGGSTFEGSGDLAVGHAVDGEVEDVGCEFGSFLPVGWAECLSGEGDTAVSALEALDAVGRFLAEVVSGSAETPALGSVVEWAGVIGTVGWLPPSGVFLVGSHGPGLAGTRPGTIFEAEPVVCPGAGRDLHFPRPNHPHRTSPPIPSEASP